MKSPHPNNRESYVPGPAAGAKIDKDGDKWTLVVVRELKHPPAQVWQALTDPAQLAQWAPFDASRSLSTMGAVTLTTIGAPASQSTDGTVTKAEENELLEYSWGGFDLRWELSPTPHGTRLTLWHNIARGFITWGAAGWHICLDVLDKHLEGAPLGRLVGPDTMKLQGWQRLVKEYATMFGVGSPEVSPDLSQTTPSDSGSDVR